MESAPDFERADALKVLTFEEEVDLWMCGSVAFPWSANQSFRCLWSGCQVRESGGCQDRRKMDVVFNPFMRRLYGGTLEWQGLVQGCHCDSRARCVLLRAISYPRQTHMLAMPTSGQHAMSVE